MLKVHSFEFNLFGVHTYVVFDTVTREAVVIDPGMADKAETDRFDAFIADNGLTLTHLVNTHLHVDHVMGADHVMERYGLTLEANSDDGFLGAARQQQAQIFHLPLRAPLSPLTVGHSLRQGDRIPVGEEYLEVIHVPGHSPGSIALYAPQEGFLISGDALFRGSIGRTDLPGGSQRQLVNALRTRVMTLPPSTLVLPGHGPSTTIASEAASNPYL